MKTTLLALALAISLKVAGQDCEWVKTINGVGYSYRDNLLQTDANGNVYFWGLTANHTVSSGDFTLSTPVGFVVSYAPDGNFRWIKTFSHANVNHTIRDMSVEEDGSAWVINSEQLTKLNASGQIVLTISHPGNRRFETIKATQGFVYAIDNHGNILKFSNTGNLVHTRNDSIIFDRVLKVNNQGVHVLGKYWGVNVSIDGNPLPDIPLPCNCTGAFYAILDEDLQAKCADQTSGYGHKMGRSTAYITSGGSYLHATGQAYSGARIYHGDCVSSQTYSLKIQTYLHNNVHAFTDIYDNIFCLFTAAKEPQGARLTIFNFNGHLNELGRKEWEGLYGTGISSSNGAIYVSGIVDDTTQIDNFTLTPHIQRRMFIAKFKTINVGISNTQLKTSSFVVPNPFDLTASIDLPFAVSNILFCDVSGKEVKLGHRISENKIIINRNGCESGVYYCYLSGEKNESWVVKLLIN